MICDRNAQEAEAMKKPERPKLTDSRIPSSSSERHLYWRILTFKIVEAAAIVDPKWKFSIHSTNRCMAINANDNGCVNVL
ncbi:MAG: hypothetical protein ACI8P9_005351 [Parasphingorhabdus sp.]|jgi:hypothetical protein